MEFKEAFDIAFDIANDRSVAAGKGKLMIKTETAKTLAFFWNMLSAAQNKLDDFAYIDNNNNIISIPAETIKIQLKNKDSKKNDKAPAGNDEKNASKKSTEKTAKNKSSVGSDDAKSAKSKQDS